MKQFYNGCLKVVASSVLALVIILSTNNSVSATHIIGGDLRYTCLGNNMYEISLELRRDCNPGNLDFDDSISITIFNEVGGTYAKNIGDGGEIIIYFDGANDIQVATDCDVVGGDVCVETTTYTTTVELPFNPLGYILAYQRCCYNSTVLNIVDPLDTGLTAWVDISPEAQSSCNSSPYFGEWADIFICRGELHTFDHSATDVDGDSLVYSLYTPNAGASSDFPRPQPILESPPFSEVTYTQGFGLMNLLGGSGTDALTIDPNTGVLTVTPGLVGQFLVGVRVTEYRNGQLLGEARRVFEYNVTICNVSINASFETDENPDCNSLDVDFTNTTTTTGGSVDCEWTFSDINGNVLGTATEDMLTYTFPAPGRYTATLVCSDGECAQDASATISVSSNDPLIDFEVNAEGCESDIVISGENNSSSALGLEECEWEFRNANGDLLSTDPNFSISGSQAITVTLTCNNELGCETTSMRTIDVEGTSLDFELSDLATCGGEDVILVPNPGTLDYSVMPDDNIEVDGVTGVISLINPMSTATYTINATDGICTETQTITVTVLDDVVVMLDDIQGCPGSTVQLNPNNDPTCDYLWSGPNGFTSDEANPEVDSENIGTYSVVVTKGDCSGDASMELSLFEVNGLGLMDISTCVGSPTPLNIPMTVAQTYNWTGPDGYTSDEQNPIVFVDSTSTFNVNGLDNNGCNYEESITITVIDAPELDLASEPLDVCEGSCINLYPNADTMLIYTWLCDDQNLVFDENSPNPEICPTENTLCVVTASDGACDVTGTVIINVLDAPPAVGLSDQTHCSGSSVILNSDGLPNGGTYMWESSDPNVVFDPNVNSPEVSVTETTVFTVTYTADNGCQVVEQAVVSLGSESMIDFPMEITQCQGDAVSLNPNGTDDYTYIWTNIMDMNDPFPVVSVMEDTEFCVTVTSDDNCVQTACINVIVLESPEINFSPDTYTVCEGSEVCLFALTGSGMTGSGMGGGMTGSGTGGGMTGSGTGGGMTGSGTCTGSGIFTPTGSGSIDIFGGNTNSNGANSIMWTLIDGTVVGMGDPFCITVDMDYSLVGKVTNDLGCMALDTVNIFAAPAINLMANAIGGPFCPGDTVQLDASGNLPFDITWFDADSTVLGTGISIITIYDPENPLVYAVADNGLGCEEIVCVELEGLPEPTIMAVVSDNNCGEVTFTASGDFTDVTWYTANPFEEIGSGNPFTSTDITGPVDIIAIATNAAGCEARDTILDVTSTPGPTIDIEINGMAMDTISICPGDVVELTAITDPDGLPIEWDNGEMGATISVSPTATTTYCASTIDENDCPAETCVTVLTDGNIDIQISVEPDVYCEGEEVTLESIAALGNIVSCEWSTGEEGSSITVTAGNDTYSVTCTDANGCTGEASITLDPSSKSVSITGPEALCDLEEGTISVDQPDPNCTYEWSDSSTGTSIDIVGSGTYSVTATDTETGCTATASLTIAPSSLAGVTATADPEEIMNGESTEICAEPSGAGFTYQWVNNTTGEVVGNTECITVSPTDNTDYTVTVTETATGCTGTATVSITVVPSVCEESQPDIPNMFTPNGDGTNDCYQIENFNFFETMNLVIYNRWGQEVFTTSSNECWNGQFENTGDLLTPDVYGYHLTWTCPGDTEDRFISGNITLLR